MIFLRWIVWLEIFLSFFSKTQLLNWNLNVPGQRRALQTYSPNVPAISSLSFLSLSRAGILPTNKYTLASLSHTGTFKPLYRFKNAASKSFKTLLLQKEGKAAICLSLASHSKWQENTFFWPSFSHLLPPKASVRIKCQCVIHMGKIR